MSYYYYWIKSNSIFNLLFGKVRHSANERKKERYIQLKKINGIFHLCPLGIYAIFNGEQRCCLCSRFLIYQTQLNNESIICLDRCWQLARYALRAIIALRLYDNVRDLQHGIFNTALSVCRSLVASSLLLHAIRAASTTKIKLSYSRDSVPCERCRLTCCYATAHYIRAICFLLIKRNILSLKINPRAARWKNHFARLSAEMWASEKLGIIRLTNKILY